MYGIMYGMQRTTVYLPDELKLSLERTARVAGRSEADLIREGIQRVVAAHEAPRPRIPLFQSSDPKLAQEVDERLEGFGER